MMMIPLGIISGDEDEERSDFETVPSSDRGNESYRDHGMIGFYTPSAEPFKTPSDVRFDSGFGADDADLERGWCEPAIRQHPAYALANWKERSSQPMESDLNPGDVEAMPTDFEFRNRNRRTKGFLTRPRVPTERG